MSITILPDDDFKLQNLHWCLHPKAHVVDLGTGLWCNRCGAMWDGIAENKHGGKAWQKPQISHFHRLLSK